MNPGLLATKLHRPPIPESAVPRPHLTQRLTQGLAARRRLTLVSAPAGFGKTTCIVEWLSGIDDRPVAWLSLDPSDNDPVRFFTYLIAAMQQVDAGLCQDLAGVLRAGQLPSAEVISTALINEIVGRVDPILLALDDLHVIHDPLILQVLDQLVTNLPALLHLILLTREDPSLPLARLRANNQLTEIRAADLRFGGRDVAHFMNDVMGLSLSAADVALLAGKTEGWIAGLQLAALAMQPPHATPGEADPSAFIAALSGSHRFILSYLTEEVLGRQPDEVQRFLLQTSILDRLNGDLCDAITGRADSRALLARLFHANLFLIPLDDEGQWYRYHHLFADLLRDRQNALDAADVVELHRRAGDWYAMAARESATFASDAIEHALAARDYALAVDLLEQHAMAMIMQGYARTVNGWVQAIPGELHSSSPRTHLAFAWMHLLRGSYLEAAPYLDLARQASDGAQEAPHHDEEEASIEAEWLVMHSLRLGMQGQMERSEATAARALDLAPEHDSRVRSLAWFARASAWQAMEAYSRAAEAYQASLQHARVAGNLVAEWLSTSGLGLMAFERGKLHLAWEIATTATQHGERAGSLPPISAVVYGLLGEVHYQWLEIEQGRRPTQRALQLSTLGGYNSGMVLCRVILSRLSQIEGDVETAGRWIQEAVDLMPAEVADYVEQEVIAQQARVHLAAGRHEMARLVLGRIGFSFDGGFSFPALGAGAQITYSSGMLYNSSLHVLLHKAAAGDEDTGLRAGIELAGEVIDLALASKCTLIAIEAHLLRARMRAALPGGVAAAEADYVRALELGAPEGVLALFVEQGPAVAEALAALRRQQRPTSVDPRYVDRILAAFSSPRPPSPAGKEQPAPETPVEPLTDRELDVLRLMAEGLKYKEIGDSLFVSLNTVRFHVKAIYGKLGAKNRTQAIRQARRLHIL